MSQDFSIIAVVQDGRLAYEALLFMASLRATGSNQDVLLFEPQPGPKWGSDPRISSPQIRAALQSFGARICPITDSSFAEDYPNGNKIDALCAAPAARPFAFFDTDTLFLKSFDSVALPFEAPTASLRRGPTWPKPGAGGYPAIWRPLYEHFGVDYAASLTVDRAADDWQRYLYFNAGFFCGADARGFGDLMRGYARAVAAGDVSALRDQAIFPWLDQIVLPLVITKLGGGRNPEVSRAIDEEITCHWRVLGLFYLREAADKLDIMEQTATDPNISSLIADYPPFRRLILEGEGRALRAALQGVEFADEAAMRKAIRSHGLWLR